MNVPQWAFIGLPAAAVFGALCSWLIFTIRQKRAIEKRLNETEAALSACETSLHSTHATSEMYLDFATAAYINSQFLATICIRAFDRSAELATRVSAAQEKINQTKMRLTHAERERDRFRNQRDREASKYEWAYPKWREDNKQRQYFEELSTGYARELNRRDELVTQLAKELEAAKSDRERIAAYQKFTTTIIT